VIRQAISCDVCGGEKRLTNHWFVAHDQNGELRVSGWNSRNRLRPGSKHLCGQTCLHKLLDDFISSTIAVKLQPRSAEEDSASHPLSENLPPAHPPAGPLLPKPAFPKPDASLTAGVAYEEESSARLLSSAEAVFLKGSPPKPSPPKLQPILPHSIQPQPLQPQPLQPQPMRAQPELVPLPGKPAHDELRPEDEPPRYASRNWRAEAWDRERERELRAVERRPEISPRRRLGS
jgi:hypothetical protein